MEFPCGVASRQLVVPVWPLASPWGPLQRGGDVVASTPWYSGAHGGGPSGPPCAADLAAEGPAFPPTRRNPAT